MFYLPRKARRPTVILDVARPIHRITAEKYTIFVHDQRTSGLAPQCSFTFLAYLLENFFENFLRYLPRVV